jgi:hypothetical protein
MCSEAFLMRQDVRAPRPIRCHLVTLRGNHRPARKIRGDNGLVTILMRTGARSSSLSPDNIHKFTRSRKQKEVLCSTAPSR